MVYSLNSPDLSRRAATYVDKIEGAKPAELRWSNRRIRVLEQANDRCHDQALRLLSLGL